MGDGAAPTLRERVWLEKFDHSEDTPRLVEVLCVEDGRLVERRASS